MTKRKQTAGRGVRDREKRRLRRWVSQALSWVTYLLDSPSRTTCTRPSTLHPQHKTHLFQRRLHQSAQLAEDFFHLY